jgi:hypothetical protein
LRLGVRFPGHSEDVSPEVLLALAGLISSIGAIIAMFVGKKAEPDVEDCRKLLKLAREEAEELAAELHEWRMKK